VSWDRGRPVVERLVKDRHLGPVEPDLVGAERSIEEGRRHLALAILGVELDPAGALQLAYDAARKACSGLLVAQGLRATSAGGHLALAEAVSAQFNDRGGVPEFGLFDRLRRQRNTSQYAAGPDVPAVTPEDVEAAVDLATKITDSAQRLLDSGRLGRF
jgi:hypothetical protein